jgi:hypothetical protein
MISIGSAFPRGAVAIASAAKADEVGGILMQVGRRQCSKVQPVAVSTGGNQFLFPKAYR